MTSTITSLQSRKLDSHLAKVRICNRPSDGWIAAIRKSLGMSARQMAGRMGISQQSAAQLENNEMGDTITLASLRKAAQALGCRLEYALIPNEGSLQAVLHRRALQKAHEIVTAVDHTMQMEAQGVGNLRATVYNTAEELMKHPKKLWD